MWGLSIRISHNTALQAPINWRFSIHRRTHYKLFHLTDYFSSNTESSDKQLRDPLSQSGICTCKTNLACTYSQATFREYWKTPREQAPSSLNRAQRERAPSTPRLHQSIRQRARDIAPCTPTATRDEFDSSTRTRMVCTELYILVPVRIIPFNE